MLLDDIRTVVRSTLKLMNVYSPEMENIVMGTFAVESEFDSLFEPGPMGPNSHISRRHGFMMLRKNKLEYIVNDWLRFKPEMRVKIHNVTGVDVTKHTLNDLERFLECNIAFMTAITWCVYASSFVDEPENNPESIGKYYLDCYDNHSGRLSVKDFVQLYKDVLF